MSSECISSLNPNCMQSALNPYHCYFRVVSVPLWSQFQIYVAKVSPHTPLVLCVTVMQIPPVEAHSFLSFSPCIELCLSGQPRGRRSQRLLHLSPLLVNKPPQHKQTSLCPPWLWPNFPCSFTCPLDLHLCHLVMLRFSLLCAQCLSNKCHVSQANSVPGKAQICFAAPFSPPSSIAQALHEFWTLKIRKYLSSRRRWVGIKERWCTVDGLMPISIVKDLL